MVQADDAKVQPTTEDPSPSRATHPCRCLAAPQGTVQMQAGLPAQIPVIRPKRIVNPHFILNDDFENLASDDLPALEADTAEGRFITDVFTEEHEEQFTHQEIDHLAEIAVDGLNTGWQALDVWE